MEQSNPTPRPAKSRLVSGTWRLLWSQQAEDASPLQKWGSSQSRNYQVLAAAARLPMQQLEYIEIKNKLSLSHPASSSMHMLPLFCVFGLLCNLKDIPDSAHLLCIEAAA
eukprot:GHRQ01027248.1.p2 GENE.GHRQ01027248.1~~GHRQ01027248.1.p2  ORF type:complete len:110 (-),score=20.98 GHRQ01027248.1:668-997(-)